MKLQSKLVQRPLAVMSALALLVGAVAPALMNAPTTQAAQLQNRILKISDSTPGASAQYELSFHTGPSAAQELIVDFCSDTPLPGATCAYSAASVPTVAAPTVSTGSVTTVGSGTPVHTLNVTGLTIPANSTFTLTFTGGITNPTSATPGSQTFYARVFTYGTGNSSGYVPASNTGDPTTLGTYVDYGGVALSVTNHVTITSRVMETLTFCVSGTNIDGSGGAGSDECSEATPPALDIGTGSPKVLDSSRVDSSTAYTQLSTNASNGAIIRMKATNACANAGLSTDGGTTCNIPGISSGGFPNGTSPVVFTLGTASYGLFVSDSRTTTGIASSTGTVTPDANYNDGSHENEGAPDTIYYGMDRQSGAGSQGVLTVYGDPIASAGAPVSRVNNNLVFAVTPSLTTPAGIYTGDEILIATGNF